jgi:hypothetical protein
MRLYSLQIIIQRGVLLVSRIKLLIELQNITTYIIHRNIRIQLNFIFHLHNTKDAKELLLEESTTIDKTN